MKLEDYFDAYDKTHDPAGLVLGALSAHAGFVRLPRASREIAALQGGLKESEAG